MKRLALIPLLLAAAPAPQPAKPAPGEIVAAAPGAEWVAIPAGDLLVMDLAADAKGRARRVVIQLMPLHLALNHVSNIYLLAQARWWDGTSINRVQDNYVVQWGDATEKKRQPSNLRTVPESAYLSPLAPGLRKIPLRDSYAAGIAFFKGWPVATNRTQMWPVHCYGMVGVGRNLSPDTGSGAELYTVIGHAPRHLDRNIALVGRVIEGIEHLSSLPRGTGALGFYEKAEERVPILSVRMGSEVKELPAFQYLSTESPTFAKYADARANRRDPFFNVPAGGADICNIPVPVRRVPKS